MDISKLNRDASKILPTLKKLPNNKLMTTKGCKIYAPARFRSKDFITIGEDIYILGIYMIVVGNYYAVSNVLTKIKITPSKINETKVNDKDYLEFVFEPGDIVIDNLDVVMDDLLPYYVYDEIMANGNVPDFYSYTDILDMFKLCKEYNGIKFSSTPTILHMLWSIIARDKKDLNKFYRVIADGKNESEMAYVAFTSNTHGASNTTARLMKAHFKDNLTGALVNPSEQEENIEHILRM